MPAIVPLIMVGGSIVGGAIAAHAANKSAETQANAATTGSADQLKAAEEALAFQKQHYADTQKAVTPYQQYGAGALAALGSGLGVTPNMSMGVQPTPTFQNGSRQATNESFTYDTLKNGPQTTDYSGTVTPNPQGQTITGTLPANSTQALSQSSVRLQAPTGEVKSVSAADAPYYIRAGAKVVQ